jgi:hypothetical protein
VRKPEGPIHSRFNVALNIDTVWYTGPSFDFFSDHNNSTAPGVSIGYAVWVDEPLSIVPEIGWSTNSVSAKGLFGGAISGTELASHNAYGGFSLRYGILSFLEAQLRLAAGASFLKATVQTNDGTTLQDNGVSPFGTLGGGVTVHTPGGALETRSGALRSMVFALTVEGGYSLGGGLDLTPVSTGDPGRIATESMSFGKLERSGPYVRTALGLRF